MTSRENIERWVAELNEDGMCDISDNQVAALIRDYNSMAVQLANYESKCRELAAENAGLKRVPASDSETMLLALDAFATHGCARPDVGLQQAINVVMQRRQTSSTDVFLAEVRASARNEGINYAASRLAAAFNHGFLDKPVAEVLDVTRMILSAKEDLANDSLPAADGLSGEYAEKAIEEWAAQLRKGAAL